MAVLFRSPDEPYVFAVIRQQDDFGFVEYDLAAPPHRFFSSADPPPRAVEIGIDSRRLRPVPTPTELLSLSLPEGDNWPAHTRRTLGKLAAWFLVCEDTQRRLESREIQTLAHQASLVRHVLDSPQLTRVLVADEVGLGKTIEAGLIVSELFERKPGLRVLYLSPARLAANVYREFSRLGLRFRKWTSAGDADANLDDDRIVASIHRAAHEGNSDKVLSAPTWDVLIVDECHHLSNYGPDGGKPLRQYQLVQKLIQKRPDARVILMSGTPNQGNPERFRNLLRLIRREGESEDAVAGRVIYRTKEDVRGWNNEPLFPLRQVNSPRVIPITKEYGAWLGEIHKFYVPEPSQQDGTTRSARRRAAGWRCAQALQWAASSVHAGLGYLIRQAVRLGWTPDRSDLGKALAVIRPYRLGPPNEPVEVLFARIKKEVGQQEQADDIEDIEEIDEARWAPDPQQLTSLLSEGVSLLSKVGDSKWDFIDREILTNAGNEQVVLFAQPIETVTALAAYLHRRTGIAPCLIIGGQSDSERDDEVKRFWSKQSQFLVSSRAGSEGINLQCAHRVVHVDVPWNPMEMEQRVGRVHRFGSRQTIVVDTAVLERTREERAYAVAYEKLKHIAHSLTMDPTRFEELFARVMSLIPPADFQDVMTETAMGFSIYDTQRIAALVEVGFSNWRTFHERYHVEQKLRAPDPGQATWEDLERFSHQYAKGKPVTGFSALRFDRRDSKEIISTLDEIPVLELPDGVFVAFADVGGRPIIGPEGKNVIPAGLNINAIADALCFAAFPDQPTGVAFLRWSDDSAITGIPPGQLGVLIFARVVIAGSLGSGWTEKQVTFHVWAVTPDGGANEIVAPNSGTLVRKMMTATIRAKPEVPVEFVAVLQKIESQITNDYRRRSEVDVAEGLRFAVFPLCAAIIEP
jgi:superfamily II DNA or RNA helicase